MKTIGGIGGIQFVSIHSFEQYVLNSYYKLDIDDKKIYDIAHC